jgi:hypothetical protein
MVKTQSSKYNILKVSKPKATLKVVIHQRAPGHDKELPNINKYIN